MSTGLEWHERVATYGTRANDATRLFFGWRPSRYVLSRPGRPVRRDVHLQRAQHRRPGGPRPRDADQVQGVRAGRSVRALGFRDWVWVGDLDRRNLAELLTCWPSETKSRRCPGRAP